MELRAGRENRALASCKLVGQRASPVHLSAVPNLDDFNGPLPVVNRVDDAIGALANAVTLVLSGEFLAPARPRGLRETLDSRNDSGANRQGLHRLELFGGGSLDEDAIACHAAEEPERRSRT